MLVIAEVPDSATKVDSNSAKSEGWGTLAAGFTGGGLGHFQALLREALRYKTLQKSLQTETSEEAPETQRPISKGLMLMGSRQERRGQDSQRAAPAAPLPSPLCPRCKTLPRLAKNAKRPAADQQVPGVRWSVASFHRKETSSRRGLERVNVTAISDTVFSESREQSAAESVATPPIQRTEADARLPAIIAIWLSLPEQAKTALLG